jgi:hypothetical protein
MAPRSSSLSTISRIRFGVIASEAKQSMGSVRGSVDCVVASLLAMTAAASRTTPEA